MNKSFTNSSIDESIPRSFPSRILNIARISVFLILVVNVCFAQTADFTANVTSGCFPLTVNFTDASTGGPVSWSWEFGNGNTSVLQNPSAIYSSPGTYTVKLTVTNGSTKTKTGFIIVHDKPDADFSFNQSTGCAPLSVNFQDLSTPGSGVINDWLWVFSDGSTSTVPNPTHTFPSSGNQTISLKVRNQFGCENTEVKSQAIQIDGPSASFTASNTFVCQIPALIQFTNQSTGSPSLTYAWTFGDGKSSTSVNPSTTFTQPGAYTVTLKATTPQGCVGTHSLTINVGNQGGLDFTSSSARVCLGQGLSFFIQTNKPLTNLKWDFGNQTTSTETTPTVIYPKPGVYKVTLSATLQGNTCQSVVTKNVEVLPVPEPSFNFTINCAGKVTFNNTSTNSNRWVWEFGNGFTSNLKAPEFTYTTPGDYPVKLTTYNELNCSMSVENNVSIPIPPQASFTPSNEQDCTGPSLSGCAPFNLEFKNLSTSALAFTSQWTFGDGTNSTVASPSHIYATQGNFTVSLKITNTLGCTHTATAKVAVSNTTPKAKFRVNNPVVCAREEVEFIDESSNATFWCWDFGDGGSALGKLVKHRYIKPGRYTVKLITKNAGCSNSFEIVNAVEVKGPYVDFTFDKTCDNPYQVDLENISVGYHTLEWDLGDEFKSTTDISAHQYAATGNYMVSLTASNTDTQCTIKVTSPVSIVDLRVDFEIDNVKPCKDAPVGFTDKSDFAVAWKWNFGNSLSSEKQNSTSSYNTPGTYTIKLEAFDMDGCTEEKTLSLNVLNIQGVFDQKAKSTCDTLSVQFQDYSTGSPPIVSWSWDFGDGKQSTNTNPNHKYTKLGYYPVTLSLTNAEGSCSFIKYDAVLFTNPIPDFETLKSGYCMNEKIEILNATQNAYTFTWEFENGNSSTDLQPLVAFNKTGEYDVTLRAKDYYGCEKVVTKSDFISITKPVAKFDARETSGECPPLISLFTNISTNAKSFSWDFGDGKKSTSENPANIYEKPGQFNVSLTVKDVNGCADTTTIERLIHVGGPTGNFTLSTPKVYCMGDTIAFNATSQNTIVHQWDFGDGYVEDLANPNTRHAYDVPGSFNVALVLIDGNGCKVNAQGQIHMDVQVPAKASFSLPECVFEKEFISLQAEPSLSDVTFRWEVNGYPVSSNPTLEIPLDTAGLRTITLRTMNEAGCVYDTTQRMPVHGYIDMIPNIFTPNDTDNLNSRFEIKGIQNSVWNLLIFNKWGKVVYNKDNYTNAWNGDDLSAGVYYYYLQNASCPDKRYKGPLTIMR